MQEMVEAVIHPKYEEGKLQWLQTHTEVLVRMRDTPS